MIMLAMPLFLALMSLVVDGGNILVHKRNIQVAADAAALAAARDLATRGIGPCTAACLASVQSSAEDYSHRNGGTDSLPACSATVTTNCFTTPYEGHDGLVEVRLTSHVTTFIAGAIGLYGANVSARAVAGGDPTFGFSTTPDSTIQGTTSLATITGGVHTTTDSDVVSGGSGVAFTMSRNCDAITYTGAGTKGGDVLGAFATNGGLDFGGEGNRKKMTWLGYNQTGCPVNPPRPPSGDSSQCKAVAWGDGTDSDNLCVKTLAPLRPPVNWPIMPPTPPTPLPPGQAFDPATDYPSRCADAGTNVGANWATTHPPGIYCVSGANTTLQFSSNGVDLTNGLGYTFFALDGAKISTSGKNLKLKFYYPADSDCQDPRPTTVRPLSYRCFGRTITNYDPETLFYATYASADGNCAICLQGQDGNLTGDIFAPKPDVFPPLTGQIGGLVTVNGGSLTAGQGFIESWNLKIGGNTGSYSGTGASIVIPGQTHTTTDPDSVTTVVTPDQTIPGSVAVTTNGTTIHLDQ